MSTVIAAMLVASLAAPAGAAKYKIDPAHSSVTFKIRHFVSQVQGSFTDFSGAFEFDDRDASKSSAEATIKTASIDTRNEKRDGHLKAPDFFDVEKFPEMKFRSKKTTPAGKGKYRLAGTLSLHGVEKPVTLSLEYAGEVKDARGQAHAGFTATGIINRKDFGIIWNKQLDSGGLMLGEEVAITIEIEALKGD